VKGAEKGREVLEKDASASIPEPSALLLAASADLGG
jgi:hypothetical protein